MFAYKLTKHTTTKKFHFMSKNFQQWCRYDRWWQINL